MKAECDTCILTASKSHLRRAAAIRRDDAGAATIETAVVLPVVLMLVFGIAGCSIVMMNYCMSTFAARAVTRYASVHSASSPTPATSDNLASMAAPLLSMIPSSQYKLASSWSPSNTVGGTVSVTISVSYNISLPFTQITQFTFQTKAQRTIVH